MTSNREPLNHCEPVKTGSLIQGSYRVRGYLAVVGTRKRLIVYRDDGVAHYGAKTTPFYDGNTYDMFAKGGWCLFPTEAQAFAAVHRLESDLFKKVGELNTEVRKVCFTREMWWD